MTPSETPTEGPNERGSKPAAAPARSARRRWSLAVLALVGLSAALWWILTPPTPQELLQKGLSTARRNPAAAEPIVRRALAAARGPFPDAELALCQLLARRGEWDEALSRFGTLDKSSCRGDLLIAFAKTALKAGREAAAA